MKIIIVCLVIALVLPTQTSFAQDHNMMDMPGMDHSKMNMSGMNHSQMRHSANPAKSISSRKAPSMVAVITPDVPHLPWTMDNGAKVFHLTAEVVKHEVLPGSSMGAAKVLTLWGYNGKVTMCVLFFTTTYLSLLLCTGTDWRFRSIWTGCHSSVSLLSNRGRLLFMTSRCTKMAPSSITLMGLCKR